VILLDVPPDVLQSRKQEVPFDETVRQREAYRALIGDMRNGRIVDANRPPEHVADAVRQVITQFMNGRTVRRFGQSNDLVSGQAQLAGCGS
jgi:thymidylate kinase